MVEAAESFFKDVGVSSGNLMLVKAEGGHAFLTEQGGAACGISATPYVSDCDYDQAKAILSWIYGPLAAASSAPQGKFLIFDQQPFSEPGDGFADEGVVYVPPACEQQTGCRIHIALHGCQQSREAIGDAFIKESGYNEIADTNRLTSASAEIDSEVIRLSRKMFRRILEEYPEVAVKLHQRILEDFQAMIRRIEKLAPRFSS